MIQKTAKIMFSAGFFTVWLLTSCSSPPTPRTPTVIEGTVVDENNNPVEGVPLRLSGINQKGLSGHPVFTNITTETDAEGRFRIEKLLPPKTDMLKLSQGHNRAFPFDEMGYSYALYLLREGQPTVNRAIFLIHQKDYGDTTHFDLQFRTVMPQ